MVQAYFVHGTKKTLDYYIQLYSCWRDSYWQYMFGGSLLSPRLIDTRNEIVARQESSTQEISSDTQCM